MFEDPLDKEIHAALKLNREDEIDLWPQVQTQLPEESSLLEFAAPLLAVAAVLAFAWFATAKPIASPVWPINDTIQISANIQK